MLPNLEHLIRLQQLENSAATDRADIEKLPARLEALDARIAERDEAVTDAARLLEEHKRIRATLEKEVAEIQGRLTRFKDQLMAVKTNKEYHAIQSEITGAEEGLQRLEDKLLERMLETDELGEAVKRAEQLLADVRAAADQEREDIESERATLEQELAVTDADRLEVSGKLTPDTRSLFEMLIQGRNGVAVSEARAGHCVACRVRLRPQLFNTIRSNDTLIQCESCQRILYFAEQRHVAG